MCICVCLLQALDIGMYSDSAGAGMYYCNNSQLLYIHMYIYIIVVCLFINCKLGIRWGSLYNDFNNCGGGVLLRFGDISLIP